MKKIILLLATGALMFGLHSCEELNIMFEDVVIEEILDINNLVPKSASIDGAVETYSFDESTTFGLSDANNGNNGDESLSDYIESLSSVAITSMMFTIIDIPEDKTLTINSLTINISGTSGELYSESFSDITPGTPIDATDLNTEAISAISEALLGNQELTLSAVGEVTGDVQTFQILTTIVSDIEANALDAIDSVL